MTQTDCEICRLAIDHFQHATATPREAYLAGVECAAHQILALSREIKRVKANHVTIAEEAQRRHDACAPLSAEIERLKSVLEYIKTMHPHAIPKPGCSVCEAFERL